MIEPYGGGLRLSVMRRPLVAPGTYDEPAERAVPPEMVEMAEAVIGRRAHEEDANALHERYEARLQALIAERIRRRRAGGACPPGAEHVGAEPLGAGRRGGRNTARAASGNRAGRSAVPTRRSPAGGRRGEPGRSRSGRASAA